LPVIDCRNCRELCRDSGEPDRQRALRTRARAVYRRGRAASRTVRAGRRRHVHGQSAVTDFTDAEGFSQAGAAREACGGDGPPIALAASPRRRLQQYQPTPVQGFAAI